MQGAGCRVQGAECRVQGAGLRVRACSVFGVWLRPHRQRQVVDLRQIDWYLIAEQPAPAPHLAYPEGCAALRIVLLTVPRTSRSCGTNHGFSVVPFHVSKCISCRVSFFATYVRIEDWGTIAPNQVIAQNHRSKPSYRSKPSFGVWLRPQR